MSVGEHFIFGKFVTLKHFPMCPVNFAVALKQFWCGLNAKMGQHLSKCSLFGPSEVEQRIIQIEKQCMVSVQLSFLLQGMAVAFHHKII